MRFQRHSRFVVIFLIFLTFTIFYQLEEVKFFIQRRISTNFQRHTFRCDSPNIVSSLFNSTILQPENPWLVVTDRKLVAFSAHYDSFRRYDSSPIITVLGVRHLHDWRRILCVIWSSDDLSTWIVNIVEGFPELMNEVRPCLWTRFCVHHPYDAFYINCPISHLRNKSNDYNIPRYNFVSLIALHNHIQTPTCQSFAFLSKINVNKVGPNFSSKTAKHKSQNFPNLIQFAVCVSPVYEWRNVILLKLFLEHYISQGCTKFVLFKRSWSKEVDKILNEKYSNFVELVEWPTLPSTTDDDLNSETVLHYRGQVVAINECLWRLRDRARFVASVDLDEFLIPLNHSHGTLSDIFASLDNRQVGGFSVSNRHFSLDLNNLSDNSPIVVDADIFYSAKRGKTVVKPKLVEKLGIHSVWRYVNGYNGESFPEDIILMYHYKPKSFDGFSINQHHQTLSNVFPRLRNRFKNILCS